MLRRLSCFIVLGPALLGILVVVSWVSAHAQTNYRSPNGRISAQVPSEWNVATENGDATFSHGLASVKLSLAPTNNGATPPPGAVVDGIIDDLKHMCPTAKVVKRGTSSLGGWNGAFALLSCDDPKRPATFKISAGTNNGEVLVCNIAAPASQYSQLLPTLNAIENSVRVGKAVAGGAQSQPGTAASSNAQKIELLKRACANGTLTPEECNAKMAALSGESASRNATQEKAAHEAAERHAHAFEEQERNLPENRPPQENSGWTQYAGSANAGAANAGTASVYRDPRGRFSLQVPAGWSATPQGDHGAAGVELASGPSWAFIGPYDHVRSTEAVVKGIISEYESQYRDFKGDYQSDRVNGHETSWGLFDAVNKRGEHVALRLAGINAGNGHFLGVMVSVPQEQAASLDPAIKRMFLSISFGE